jgi:hypothetical protein
MAAVRHCGEDCVGLLFLVARAFPSRVASPIRCMRVARRRLNTSVAQDRHDSPSIHSRLPEPGCGCMSQVVEVKVFQFGLATGRAKSPLDIGSRFYSLPIHKQIFRVTRFHPEG